MLDAQGNIWIAGTTNATDLPVTANALKKTSVCGQISGDGFLAEVTGDGSRLLYAAYIGTTPSGSLSADGSDMIVAAAEDSTGHICMVGNTNGSDFPVTGVSRNTIRQPISCSMRLTSAAAAMTTSRTFKPGGSFVVSGASNVAAYVETGAASSPSVYAVVGSFTARTSAPRSRQRWTCVRDKRPTS